MQKFSVWTLTIAIATALLTASCREQSMQEGLAEANKLVGEGNAKGAVVIYKTLLENYPDDPEARFELANAYLLMGKPDQAEREAKRLAALSSPPPHIRLLLGKIHIAQDKAKAALEDLAAELATFPDAAEAWEVQGIALAREKNFDKAEESYQRALALEPGRIPARTGLIETMLARDQPARAKEQLDILLGASPDNRAGLYLLAQYQARQNDIPGVIAAYAALASRYPQEIRARYNEAALLLATQGLSDKVAQTAQTLIKEFPNQPEGYKLQGLVKLAQNAPKQAITDFQQALRLRPEIETRFFLAQAYERTGSHEMAISELRAVLDAFPRHIQARQLLARLELRLNRPEASIAELEKLLQFHPDDASTKLMLGDVYLLKKDFNKSLGLFSDIPEGSDQSAAAQLMKGLALAGADKKVEAEAALRQAAVQAPANLEIRLALAALLKQSQRLEDALEILAAQGLAPADAAQACLVQAEIRMQQGRLDDGMALLEKAKALSPELIGPYQALAQIHLQRFEPDKALAQYTELLARLPQSPEARRLYAAVLEQTGALDEAGRQLQQAAQSGQAEAYLELAAFLERGNQKAEAVKTLEQCLQKHGDSLPALVSMARLQAEGGNEAQSLATIERIGAIDQTVALAERLRLDMAGQRWDEAEAEAAKFIEFNPASASASLPLAAVKARRGDLPGAEQTVRKALETDPTNAAAQLELGSLLLKQGRTQEAFAAYDAVIAKGDNLAAAYASRGMAWQLTGNLDAAIKDYEAALRLQNKMPMVLNNLAMLYADQPARAGKSVAFALAANALAANNPLILDTLGYALLKNGRKKEAAGFLQRAAALAPQNEDIKQHLNMMTATKD